SVDPMWENDQDKTPYHVCKNNPVKLIDYDGRKVINEDDVDYINEFDYYSNVQNEFIEKYGQNAYGLKSKDFSRVEDYAEYKRYKKDFHNSSKRLSYFRKASENTQKEINDFKEKCPDLYETMNNLTYFNDIGEEKELDIHISSNNKGRNVNVYHFGGAYTQPRILYKNSIFTSAEAFIFLGTHIGKGGHLAHEMGHVMSFAILPLLYYEVAKQIGGVHNCQEEANLPLLKRSFISMWAIEYQNIFLGR
ncbi:MAG: hypothetical protein MJZ34_16795, partial [Paludibacteraceae bacterium]|nr:hypothetical protein [Paludibacteraceae bacterium]